MTTRPAAVANMFYSGDAPTLLHDIKKYIAKVIPGSTTPKAIIVPHAGYHYSGTVAAHAFAQIQQARHSIKKVVLLGPCHRVPLNGLALPSVDYFETPLGKIPLDREAMDNILQLPQVQIFDQTHQQEHSLEVQLPFLQQILDDFDLVPLVVGDASSSEVSEVIERLWGGDETLIVISSDLSHFMDYDTAMLFDGKTCAAIESLNGDALHFKDACGRIPIQGMLESASRRHMKVTTLDMCNSGDTTGARDRVVGYGAWMFEE